MSCEATDFTSITRQSNATTALSSAGDRVARVDQLPVLNRFSRVTWVRPANVSAMISSPARNVLTQKTPFSRRIGMLVAARLRQTSSVAGLSDTDTTAVAVKPLLPAGPSVVTI